MFYHSERKFMALKSGKLIFILIFLEIFNGVYWDNYDHYFSGHCRILLALSYRKGLKFFFIQWLNIVNFLSFNNIFLNDLVKFFLFFRCAVGFEFLSFFNPWKICKSAFSLFAIRLASIRSFARTYNRKRKEERNASSNTISRFGTNSLFIE